MSVLRLATRTGELGYPIHRTAISKIESGERVVTVAELIILAAALSTTPMALLVADADAPQQRAIRRLFQERDARFSRFVPTSELSRVNRRAGRNVLVSPAFAEALYAALDAADGELLLRVVRGRDEIELTAQLEREP